MSIPAIDRGWMHCRTCMFYQIHFELMLQHYLRKGQINNNVCISHNKLSCVAILKLRAQEELKEEIGLKGCKVMRATFQEHHVSIKKNKEDNSKILGQVSNFDKKLGSIEKVFGKQLEDGLAAFTSNAEAALLRFNEKLAPSASKIK